MSMGTSNPPSERMVRPEPAKVKTVQMATVAMARPPGIQLKSAVKTRSKRWVAPPCTMKYPASVNSGMDGNKGEATSRYISTGTDATGVPLLQKSNSARPPKTAKIGRPTTVARASSVKKSGRIPGMPTGMAKPNNAGTNSPSAARARFFPWRTLAIPKPRGGR